MNPRIPAAFAPFICLALVGLAAPAARAQSVPGCTVSSYATNVNGPVWLDFAPDGTLFCGRDSTPAGTPNPRFISRVGSGGSPVSDWGLAMTPDPDAVVFDEAGLVSGVPGSVLTGGIKTANTVGAIHAVRPDQSVVELWSSTAWINPAEMVFDRNGRFVFGDVQTRTLRVSSAGEAPTLLATLPSPSSPASLTVAPDNRLFVSDQSGNVLVYAPDGSLLDASYASFPSRVAIEFGRGGAWGHELYALRVSTGTLHRIDALGAVTQIGSGFASGFGDLTFGPDRRMYIGRFNAGDVLVVEPDGWSSYCTSGVTTHGCTPSMRLASGAPSASGAGTAIVAAVGVEGARQGLVFFGLGASALPWSPGSTSFLCVKSPTQRSPVVFSGGSAGTCEGVISADLSALILSNGGHAVAGQPVAAGSMVFAQAWFRDPPAAKSTNLSDAISITLAP